MIAQPAIKRRIGIGLVAVCAMLLTSCAAGQHAQTGDVVAAIDGTSGTIGDLQLHAVAIKPPTSGPSYKAGDAVELQIAIVNVGHATDTLRTVTSPAVSGYQVFGTAAEASAAVSTPAASTSPATSSTGSSSAADGSSATTSTSASAPPPPTSLEIPPGQALRLSITDDVPVLLLLLSKPLFPGTAVKITFTFANSGSLTLSVPIQITVHSSPVGISVPPPSETGAA